MRHSVDKLHLDLARLAHMQALHPFRLFSVLQEAKSAADRGNESAHGRVVMRRKPVLK